MSGRYFKWGRKLEKGKIIMNLGSYEMFDGREVC